MTTSLDNVNDPLATDPIVRATRLFDGCPQRAEIGVFLLAYAAEQRLRGFAIGAVVGIGVAIAAAVYLKTRGAK